MVVWFGRGSHYELADLVSCGSLQIVEESHVVTRRLDRRLSLHAIECWSPDVYKSFSKERSLVGDLSRNEIGLR